MKKLLLSTVVAAGALFATAADAAFTIENGNLGTISVPSNTGVVPVFGTSTRDGYYSSQITLAGAGTITYEILGYEAGAQNTFGTGLTNLFTTPGGNGENWAPVLGATGTLASGTFSGLVDFFFSTTDGRAQAQGGSNKVSNGDANDEPSVNFFATFGDQSVAGSVLYLFFDDRGGVGVSDDNHDDLAVKLTFTPDTTNVPEPASLALFGAGLLGLGLARRRKAA